MLLYRASGGGWIRAEPGEYRDERDLHDLLVEDPSILPTDDLVDAAPAVAVGYETALGSGYADAIFLSTDGLLTICEVKLRKNSESRREVLAQALSYAAFLEGMSLDDFMDQVVYPFCRRANRDDLVGASILDVMSALSGEDIDPEVLVENLQSNLDSGDFRVLVVLDEVHAQLRKSAAYVNRHATFDVYLVEVGIHRSEDGEHEILQPKMLDVAVGSKATGGSQRTQGRSPQDWLDRAVEVDPDAEPGLRQLLEGLTDLQRRGLVELATGTGARISLKVFVAGTTKSIIWVWEGGGVSIPRYALPRLGISEERVESWVTQLAEASAAPPATWDSARKEPQVVLEGRLRDLEIVHEVLRVVEEAASEALSR